MLGIQEAALDPIQSGAELMSQWKSRPDGRDPNGDITHAWCIRPGDQLSVKVWNAQIGGGPAIYPIVASSGTNTCP
jgi:hypothetical protein